MKESNTLRNKLAKRYLSANGSLLLPLALKWRLVRIVACSLFIALVLPCLAGGSVSAASITLTVPGRLTLNAAADGAFHESATAATVSVKSDAYSGYTLGVKSGESSSPALKNGSNTISSISSAMAGTSFPVNTWGWLPNKLGGQANSQYQPGPTSTLVTIEKTASPNASTANSYTIKLGAKVNGTIPAGTYVNTFTFTATANPVPYTITYQGESAPGKQTGSGMEGTQITLANAPTRENYEFKGWCTVSTSNETCPSTGKSYTAGGKYTLTNSANNVTLYAMWKQKVFPMQSWGQEECSKLAIGDTVMLIDTRDNNTYRARKLADSGCWMIDNLRLGDSKLQNRTLTSANTDLNNGLTAYELPESARGSGYDMEKIYVVESDSSDGTELRVYGGYYTWNAATAGTGAGTAYGDNAPSSICPKGWKLPIGDWSADSEFSVLKDALGTPSDGDKDAYFTNPDGPNFLRGGYYSYSYAYSQGEKGYYWSSTRGDDSGAWGMIFNSPYASSGVTFRHYASSVRCVVANSYNINYNLNGGANAPSTKPKMGSTANGIVKIYNHAPTKCGYAFQYWCSANNTANPTACSGTHYNPGDSYVLSNGATPTLYAVWKTTGTDLGDFGSMQSFTCSRIPGINGFGTVTDNRDGNTYCVRKLADNKCWMTDNLRLGDSKLQNRTLTSANTDLNGKASYILPNSSKDSFDEDDNAEKIYVVEADSGSELKVYGGYYSWNAATAGTGAGLATEHAVAPSSICPKGWRLPTGGNYSDSSEFWVLDKALGVPSDGDKDAYWTNPDGPNFLRGGSLGASGLVANQGETGMYWTSMSSSRSSAAIGVWISKSSVTTGINFGRDERDSVRCIAR